MESSFPLHLKYLKPIFLGNKVLSIPLFILYFCLQQKSWQGISKLSRIISNQKFFSPIKIRVSENYELLFLKVFSYISTYMPYVTLFRLKKADFQFNNMVMKSAKKNNRINNINVSLILRVA